MKISTLFILALTLVQSPVFAADDAKMMDKFKEYSTPSEGHKKLQQMAGKWTYTSKMWMTADAKPEESTGTSTMKMIFGGRYLEQEVKQKSHGSNYDGMGLIGFNNLTKNYQTVWIDNMGTGIMEGTGSFDEATQTLTDNGKFTCPFTKAADHQRDYRTELKIADKNNATFTMYSPDLDSGKEYKMMELTYKRVK